MKVKGWEGWKIAPIFISQSQCLLCQAHATSIFELYLAPKSDKATESILISVPLFLESNYFYLNDQQIIRYLFC